MKKVRDSYICQICILIDQSIPSPKSLMTALKETNLEETKHGEDIFQRVLDKLPDDRARFEYCVEVIKEAKV